MSYIDPVIRTPIEQYILDKHTFSDISGISPSAPYYPNLDDLNIGDGRVSESDDDDDKYEPLSIFPIGVPQAFEIPSIPLESHYADQWPIGFVQGGQWSRIWSGTEYEIDRYLRHGRIMHTGENVPWTPETQFKGVRWRLVIDLRKNLHDLPIFTDGMIISFQNCNTQEYHYIIDHCAYQDELFAYLKVFCFRSDHYVCETWTSCPPIILAVPLTHCDVRNHPNTSLTSPKQHSRLSNSIIHFRIGNFSSLILRKLKAVF